MKKRIKREASHQLRIGEGECGSLAGHVMAERKKEKRKISRKKTTRRKSTRR